MLHVVYLSYPPMPPFPKLEAREVKSKGFSPLKYSPQCEFIMCAPAHRCCSSTSSRCGRHDNHNGGRWDNSLCQHYTPVMSLRFGTLNLHTMHIFRTFSLASLLWSVRKYVCRIFQHFWGWLRVGWAPAADFFNLLFSYKNKHLHSTLKPRYSEQVCQTLFVHYVKCNMLIKSSKWELGLVHYITKFTIWRFVISKFECISKYNT